eukprot:2161015-Pleurochrysis_carterae.AAC.1
MKVTPLHAGARRKAARDMRGGGERNRRSERRAESGAERVADADGLQGVQDEPGDLPLYAAEVQIFFLQSPPVRDTDGTQGPGARGGKELAHAGVAARRQRMWKRGTWKWGSGAEQGRGTRREGQGEYGRMVRRIEGGREMETRAGGRREDDMVKWEEEERRKGCLETELKVGVKYAHGTHITSTATSRLDAMNAAHCPIHCAILSAIQTGKNRIHNTPGTRASSDKPAAMYAAHCPIHNAIQSAIAAVALPCCSWTTLQLLNKLSTLAH